MTPAAGQPRNPDLILDPDTGEIRRIRVWRCMLCPEAVWVRGGKAEASAHYIQHHQKRPPAVREVA